MIRRRYDAREAVAMAFVDAPGEPFGRQLARELRALQVDARHDRARQRALVQLLGVGEDTLMQRGLLEVAVVAPLQVASDRRLLKPSRPASEFAARSVSPLGALLARGRRSPSNVTGRPDATLNAFWNAAFRLAYCPALKSAKRNNGFTAKPDRFRQRCVERGNP
jgi:hypothetical protein